MRRIAVLALPILVVACADTIAERRAELSPYLGQTEQALVRDLGVPSRSIETGGHRYLAYTELKAQVIDDNPGFFYRRGPIGLGPEITVINRVCETTFDIADGKVAGFSFKGNAC